MKNKRGFSLVELLAVVVLLGVIIAIAIPSYNKYIEKTKDKKYESYEYAMEDAAEMFIQQCLVKNKCPNGQEYNDVLGQKVYLNVLKNNLKINEEFNGCQLENSYVKVEYNASPNTETEIDNYDYKVCLKCGEYTSGYCGTTHTPVSTEYDLDNNNYTIYTNNREYEVEDGDFDTDKHTYPTNCSGNKKGGIKCKITSSDFIGDKATLQFNSKTEGGTDYKFEVIYDAIGPEITTVSIEDEDEWRQRKKVEITYKSEGANATKLKVLEQEYSLNEPNGTISVDVDKTGTHRIEIFDKLGNLTTKNIEVNKITDKPSVINLFVPPDYQKEIYFSIIPGETGMLPEKQPELEVFVADHGSTTLIQVDAERTEGTFNYTISGVDTGIKDIYIKEFKNEADVLSTENLGSTIKILNDVKYHKYENAMFDNTPPNCNIVAKYENENISEMGTYPYLSLEASVTDSHSGPSERYTWDNGAGFSQIAKVSDEHNYVLEVEDIAGNKSTCEYSTINKIDNTSPKIEFLYDGLDESLLPEWNRGSVTLGARLISRNSAKLKYYNYNGMGNVDINQITYDIPVLDTFDETGQYFGSITTGIQGMSSMLETPATSATINIDNTSPYTPYVSSASIDKNGNSLETPNCTSKTKTGSVICNIQYVDPQEWYSAFFVNFEPATITLNIDSIDNESGRKRFFFSSDGNSWEEINQSSFQSKINNLTKNMGWVDDVDDTIYLKSEDNVGNQSGVLTIRFNRRLA